MELGSVINFNDLHANLVAHSSANVHIKRFILNFLESLKASLTRFNKKMLKVKDLIKHASINGVRSKTLGRELHALLNRGLLKAKQAIEGHI
ncbi:hypothetical protein SADUNF_Sadunf04G0117000 [Salix dunnii]|uniref:Uncharacterized protein n=1 Tax=Salix dunnii TaxID=1413687 RepID=A0A835N0Z4_9ROSI|nr:hypothetical protein SADUNF_Sadunf04G0117000 [Salix dunnii]